MRTRRAIVLGALAQALSTTSGRARAQQLAKMPRIGLLWFAGPNDPAVVQNTDLFRRRLRELGYVEGKTIQIEVHHADGDPQRLSEVAREVAHSKVDIMVAPTLIAAVAARQATDSVAIVMVQAGNPMGAGLISSLSRPGGNVTGSTNFGYGSKQVEFMHELLPRARKVAILANLANAGVPPNLATATDAAHKLGIEVVVASVTRPDESEQAFATIRKARPDGLLVLSEPVVADRRAQVVDLAASMSLPVCSDSARDARAGHLMSVGSLLGEHFLMAATYVDKILKGTKPADLPVEQPSRFEVIFNLKTAKALGIVVPQSLLLRATEVIE
jgi:putative ABC transport system substrate-binding protein